MNFSFFLFMNGSVMALELAPHKIRINTVVPGIILTELGRVIWSDQKKAAEMTAKIPQGRFAGNFIEFFYVSK